MTAQPEKTYLQGPSTVAPAPVVEQETGYDVLATVGSFILVLVFAAVVGTQGIDYVAAKIERFADVTSWVRR
jgi:hypothetical protein